VPIASTAFTTSMPSTTSPNTTSLPSSYKVTCVVMKNCQPARTLRHYLNPELPAYPKLCWPVASSREFCAVSGTKSSNRRNTILPDAFESMAMLDCTSRTTRGAGCGCGMVDVDVDVNTRNRYRRRGRVVRQQSEKMEKTREKSDTRVRWH
jgi:hypothetical protein